MNLYTSYICRGVAISIYTNRKQRAKDTDNLKGEKSA